MRYLREEDIEGIAVGAAVLGSGGGGDPYVGKLMAKQAIRAHGPVRLIEADELADGDLVIPSAAMGAPSVMLEKLPNGKEPEIAFRALEKYLGRKAQAVISIEAGGLNSCIPIYTAACLGLPLVDGDGMGRAFPELPMVSFSVGGVSASPMVVCDEKGNMMVLEAASNQWAELLARTATVAMGLFSMLGIYPMDGATVKRLAIRGTMSLAGAIGDSILAAGASRKSAVDSILDITKGFRLFEGKIVDVKRDLTSGFTRGTVVFEGLGRLRGKDLRPGFPEREPRGLHRRQARRDDPRPHHRPRSRAWLPHHHREPQVRPARRRRGHALQSLLAERGCPGPGWPPLFQVRHRLRAHRGSGGRAEMKYKLGIDVGGTNTDAAILDEAGRVVASCKEPTSPDVSTGIDRAVERILAISRVPPSSIADAMLGTTHATNAIVERKQLSRVAAIRLSGPSGHSIPPFAEWPADLLAAIGGSYSIVKGGYEYNGAPIAAPDRDEIRRALDAAAKAGAEALAISSAFAPVNSYCEELALELAREALGADFPVTLSHEIGSIGLIERENAAILNAAIRRLAERAYGSFQSALSKQGVAAELFITQNDGTLMSIEYAKRYPVLTIASGPTNSLRGAAFLSKAYDAIVVDVGGTTTDVGVLRKGFPPRIERLGRDGRRAHEFPHARPRLDRPGRGLPRGPGRLAATCRPQIGRVSHNVRVPGLRRQDAHRERRRRGRWPRLHGRRLQSRGLGQGQGQGGGPRHEAHGRGTHRLDEDLGRRRARDSRGGRQRPPPGRAAGGERGAEARALRRGQRDRRGHSPGLGRGRRCLRRGRQGPRSRDRGSEGQGDSRGPARGRRGIDHLRRGARGDPPRLPALERGPVPGQGRRRAAPSLIDRSMSRGPGAARIARKETTMSEKTAQKAALTEDYGAKPVPVEAGKSWFGIGMVYWGSAMCLPTFFIAGLIAGPMPLGKSILIYAIAGLVLGLVSILTGILGAGTRLSTGLTARFTFGKAGANILQLVLFFALWGWFGVQLGFMVSGFGDGGLMLVLGTAVPAWVYTLLGGFLITLTAIVGYKAIEKLSVFAMPLIVVMLLVTIAREYLGAPVAAPAAAAAQTAMPFGAAVSLLVGSFIIGAIVTPDVTRYAKSKPAAGWGLFFGMVIGFPVVLSLGAIMVKGSGGEFDFSKIMMQGGSPIWAIMAVLTILLASWTTNDVNLYSGSLSLNAMFPKLSKVWITAISGAVGTGLALLGINTAAGFQSFLGIIAILIPPAAAVMIADYFLFKGDKNRGYASEKADDAPAIRVLPLVSWAVGAAFGFVVQFAHLRFTTVTAVDAIIASAVVYIVAMLATKNKIKLSI